MKLKTYLSLSIFVVGACVISCSSNDKQSEPPAKVSKSVPAIDNGKVIFGEKCALCHGDDGTAGISDAANLQTSELDSISIIRIITHGKNAMPAFVDQLGTGEIEQVAAYVNSLRTKK